jgi:hypothetical protein
LFCLTYIHSYVYLYIIINSKTMTNQQVVIREKWMAVNNQINSQLKRMKITNLAAEPESEWKQWILDLMKIRTELDQQGA